MATNKSKDEIVELIIRGEDEYSAVSEDVRKALSQLSQEASETKAKINELDRALDLTAKLEAQAQEVKRLAQAQGEAKVALETYKQANKDAIKTDAEAAAKIAELTAANNSAASATRAAQRAYDKTAESIRKYGIDTEKVKAEQDQMRDASGKLADTLTDLVTQQNDTVDSAVQLAEETKKQAEAQKQAAEAAQQAMAEWEAYADSLTKAYEADQKKQQAANDLKAEMSRLLQDLENGNISWEDYRRSVADAGKASGLTGREVAQVNKDMEQQVLAAKNAAASNKDAVAEQKRVAQATEDYRVGLQKLVLLYKERKISQEQFNQSEAELRSKLKLTEQQVSSTRRAIGGYTQSIQQVEAAQNKAAKSTDALTQVTRRIAQAYTVLLAAKKSVDMVVGNVKAYSEQENAMIGLQKTTELTANEMEALRKEFTRLSTESTPTTVSGLMDIAAAAGRMGIEGAKNIASFTKATDALASATGISAEQSAMAIAQILNVTGEAQENVAGVASSIADLGNKTATTEDQIVHFSKRLAADTATVELTSAEVIGLSASLAEMGVRAEGASSVVGRTFRYINDAVVDGGYKMQALMNITGKTSDELKAAFGQDKVKMFSDFLGSLGDVQDSGTTMNSILEDMGFKSDENARILGLLSKTHERLAENVETSNKAFTDADTHLREQASTLGTVENNYKILQNRLEKVRVAFGEAFSDNAIDLMQRTGAASEDMEASMAELGEVFGEIANFATEAIVSTLNFGEALDDTIKLSDGFKVVGFALQQGIEGIVASFDAATLGIAAMAKAFNEWTGDTEAADKWAERMEVAHERVLASAERLSRNNRVALGETSRAYEDLAAAYRKNSDALEYMDAEQRATLETIMKSTGYVQGADDAYRKLTKSLSQAAGIQNAKNIEDETSIRLINERVSMLRAEGKTLEEATRIAKEEAAAKVESETKKKDAIEETTTALGNLLKTLEKDKQLTEASEEANKKLGESLDLLTKESIELGSATSETTDEIERLIRASQGHNQLQMIEQAILAISTSSQLANDDLEKLQGLLLEQANQLSTVESAYKSLGIVSQQALNKAAQDARLWVDEIVKANKPIQDQQRALEEYTKRVYAAGEGYEELRKTIEDMYARGVISAEEYETKIAEVNERLGITKNVVGEVGEEAEKTTEKLKKMGDAGKDAGDQTESGLRNSTQAAAGLAGMINSTRERLMSMSAAAHNAYIEIMGGTKAATSATAELETQLARVQENLHRNATLMSANGGGRWFKESAVAANSVEKAFLEQKIALEKLMQQYNEGNYSAGMFSNTMATIDSRFRLLDQQDLSNLKNAVRDVQMQAQSLSDSLGSTIDSLKIELAALQDDNKRVEELRYRQRRNDIELQYQEAVKTKNYEAANQAREALRLLEQTHKLRLADIKAQDDARKKAEADRAAEQERKKQEQLTREREQAQQAKSQPKVESSKTIKLELKSPSGKKTTASFDSQREADAFLQALEQAGLTAI